MEEATKDITKLSKKLENAADFQAWKWTMLMFPANGVLEVVDGSKPDQTSYASDSDEEESDAKIHQILRV